MPDDGTAARADDTALLDAVQRGNSNAAATMMQRHNRALYRIARGILGDDGEAEEAVQDTWLRAFTSAHAYRAEASLGTWLARIAINEALRRAKRHRPVVALDAIADQLPVHHSGPAIMTPPPVSPEQAAARAEIRAVVERAIDGLSAPFRLVFVMRVIEQMSIEETAAALAIPAATVKTRLHRANEQLRAMLGSTFSAILEDSFPFGGKRCARLADAVLARLPRDGPAASRHD